MKTFILQRTRDISGVSGTGIVAQGVEFDSGKAVMHWFGAVSSVVIYESIADLEKIHGHEGATKIVFD